MPGCPIPCGVSPIGAGRADKGLLRRYLIKVTGLPRAQVSRAIRQFDAAGRIEDRRKGPAKPFQSRYMPADIRLLAEVDALHSRDKNADFALFNATMPFVVMAMALIRNAVISR